MIEPIPTNCAVCQLTDGLVVNIIVAVPTDPAQEGCELVEVMSDQPCGIGWYWDGVNFNPPVVDEFIPEVAV